MKLRAKTLIYLTIAFLVVISLAFFIVRAVALNSFAQVEQQMTVKNIQQGQQALDNIISGIDRTSTDWAYWDDSYVFAQDLNQQYIESNMNDASFSALNINVIYFLNPQLEVIYSRAIDLSTGTEDVIPDVITDSILNNQELWDAVNENSSISGLLMAESTPLIISVKPILTSQRTGPFHGYMIMVRYLGDDILEQLRQTTGMDMDLLIIGWNSPMAISNFPDSNPLPGHPEMIYHISGQTIIGYTTLYDVLGHTALFLRIDNPRTVYGLAQQTILYLLATLILTGLVFGGALYLLMGRLVLNPVTTLDSSIKSIADSGNLTKRVDVFGKDEIAELSKSMNSMLANLQHSQEEVSRRLVQLQTAADVSRTISSVLDPQELLQQVVDLIKVRFDLYYVGLFLLDDKKENAVLRAGTGEPGQIMVNRSHHLAVGGTSMIGWATRNRQARISLDTDYEETRFSNPLLPSTRSEMALPILTRAEVLGALSIQSEQRNAFDENDILVLQSIADSLAVALDNARLFQQARDSIDEIRRLNQAYLHTAWEEAIEQHDALKFTYESKNIVTSESTPVSVPISLRDQVIGSLELETSQSGLSDEEKAFIESVTIQTALALENARLLEQTRRRASQEEKINQIVTQFSRSANVEQILKSTLQELGQLPNVAEVTVQLLHRGEEIETIDGDGHHVFSDDSSGE